MCLCVVRLTPQPSDPFLRSITKTKLHPSYKQTIHVKQALILSYNIKKKKKFSRNWMFYHFLG